MLIFGLDHAIFLLAINFDQCPGVWEENPDPIFGNRWYHQPVFLVKLGTGDLLRKVLDLSDLYQMGVSENGVLTIFMVYYWFIISFPVNMAIWGHTQFSDRPRFQVSLRPFGSFWYLAMSSFSTRPTHVPNLYHFSLQDYRTPLCRLVSLVVPTNSNCWFSMCNWDHDPLTG